MRFGLTEKNIEAIIRCLSNRKKIQEAVLYGSRAKGNYKPGSDIDLTLKGAELTISDMSKLENELDELLLPYKFDISIFHQIDNQDLIDHIARVGVVFYKRSTSRNSEFTIS